MCCSPRRESSWSYATGPKSEAAHAASAMSCCCSAGLVWAGYNVLGKYAGRGQDAVNLTYYQTVAGAAGFLLASLLEIGDLRVPDVTASALLAYLAVACSVGGFLLYNYGLRRMTSSVAVNILNLVPVFGVLGAVVINGETVRLAQVFGGVIIIAGVALGMVERRTAVEEAAVPEATPVGERA